jgi:hypothetical protein
MSLALVRSGALMTGYELVKTAVEDDVRNFFTVGLDDDLRLQARYRAEGLSLGSNKIEASINWLVQNDGLTAEHVATLAAVRLHRNEVAHELARLLIDPDADVDVDLLMRLNDVVVALDRFWGPIHIDSNPDFDGKGVDPNSFFSGTRLLFGLLVELAQVEVK